MLSKDFTKLLISKSHQLHPLVTISHRGLTDSINNEINQQLLAHELIKIRLLGHDSGTKQQMLDDITNTHQADLVHKIGHVAVLYRKNPEKFS